MHHYVVFMSLMDEFIKIYAVFPARVHIVAL